jgi:P-type Mg2+ transporter
VPISQQIEKIQKRMVWQKFSSEDVSQALSELQSSEKGLSPDDARERLRATGRNELEEASFSLIKLMRRRAHSSFLYLLLAASGLSYFLGERLDALLILIFIAINISLETYQEYHSEKATRLLKRYLVVHTRVRRGGKVMTVASRDIVPGDIVLVEAGDRLPADVRFILVQGLEIDESLMTGESAGTHKKVAALDVPPTEMYEAQNIGFAGTVVTAGRGEGIVFATGQETALGEISSLTVEKEHKTEFEKWIAEFSRFILKFVILTLALVFIANILIKGDNVNIPALLVFSLALAVSVVPEALPVIVTVAFSRGSLRLAQKKVIVKRLSAIEDLGNIEVLCVDKTGTLTENMLSVNQVKAEHPAECLRLAFSAALETPLHRSNLHDAFDLALWQKLSSAERLTVQKSKRLDTIPFDPERRRNSVLLQMADDKKEIVVRGAPEEIIRLSDNLDTYTAKSLMQWMREAGHRGERVLAVARKSLGSGRRFTLYEEQHLEFVGLISFADRLKSTAKETIAKAQAFNVQVKILTGDSPEVAGAVGCAVGLIDRPEAVLTGKALFALSYEERRRAILEGALFARISPREKYEIIKIIQEKHTVGFLGEGINDAPALKIADVGLVVQGASDIAREAADIVLLQKSLETVVDGIKEGRTIFANVLKYIKITLTSNFGNFYSVALASLFMPFIPLLPIQILLLNLLSDFPMIAIATDTVDAEQMESPKNHQVHSIILAAILLGGVSSLFDFMLFGVFVRVSPSALQTAWFILSVITEVFLIFSLRTKLVFFRARRPSFLLIFLSLAVLVVTVLLPFVHWGASIFHFIRPDASFVMIIASLSVGYFIATETVKRLYYSHPNGWHILYKKNKQRTLAGM